MTTSLIQRSSGSYTANLLGNIRSHLAGLQGYDVMALELIQNADDAKANEIVFDISDRGLLVRNSAVFTYCGNMHSRPCSFKASTGESCDYHRIADVGSGGKLSRGENIGRFGIGFVSTYQITDHPEVRSAGIKLTLHPEVGQWFIEAFDEPGGTSFFLPWASDPDTEARLALGVSHVSAMHIDRLAEDLQSVLRKSLLFLRHVQRAEVWRNGALLLACDLDRSEASDVIVSFRPTEDVEHWHVLRADAADAAARLYATHPRLESVRRSTKISIGLRIDPGPLAEGLLYAFLPTEQLTGLAAHINADFFPESDRKAVIFAGHQHEQAWNEMLMDAAAVELARDPEALLQMLGPVPLWQILSRAYDLSSKPSGHPACFKAFWERFKATTTQARIAGAQDGSVQRPSEVFLSRNPLNAQQVKALLEVGGSLASEELRPFQTAMNQLGAPVLTLERMVSLLEAALAGQEPGSNEVDKRTLDHFYRPLWSIVEALLPDAEPPNAKPNAAVQRLRALPFLISADLFAVSIEQSYAAPAALDAGHVAKLLPRLAIASKDVFIFPKIARLIAKLNLATVVTHISSLSASERIEDVIGIKENDLTDLYSLFADLDQHTLSEEGVYPALRDLPIWRSSGRWVKASQVLLPGNFTDPTGHANLLDTSVLSNRAREFVTAKLGVQTQTIEAFVSTVLPTYFADDGPRDETKYVRLMTELASHSELQNNEQTRRLLGSLPMLPTQDGGWSRPIDTYRRADNLVKVLGDASHLWLDDNRIPSARAVHSFIDSLGLRRSPLARHLVGRMLHVAAISLPTEDAKRDSSEAFYAICDQYDERKDVADFQDALDDLRQAKCFPAADDSERWHSADALYAPYRADAFRSQAKILDFRNTARLKTELLEELDIAINPETQLVIDHLRHCVAAGVPPHVSTYQVLNERAQTSDPVISSLAGSRCIYVESHKSFVRPNQIYWTSQQLGRYAFIIPGNLESFKPLFTAIGVKNAPGAEDLVDILLDIIGPYYEQSKPLVGTDRAVYDVCIASISSAHELGALAQPALQRLQEAPTILNLRGLLTHPDEVLLQDSEWHASFFNGELDQALCRPAPELWSLLGELGVKRLSESAHVSLEYVDGPLAHEMTVATTLTERADIFARLLHDKPSTVRKRIRSAFAKLEAVSYEVVRIQASVRVGGAPALAPPMSTHAFYDIENGRLILSRPISDRSWAHVLNAIFHQLMPEASGNEVSKLTLGVRPLMAVSVPEAHRELGDAGIPDVESAAEDGKTEDLATLHLDELGTKTEEVANDEPATNREFAASGQVCEHATQDALPGNAAGESVSAQMDAKDSRDSEHDVGHGYGTANAADTNPNDQHAAMKPRPRHKEQWDRRLLSYVRRKQHEASEPDGERSQSDHNLAVEASARDAVCTYEKERGRAAQQMAQTHPGYDIISRDPGTGESRLIEVKGVDGEWNQTGVGLSRLQFSNAQNFGDNYWLYVVEYATDPQKFRVHPIRSPATQVTTFMFDCNWRDAVTEERADRTLRFIPGVRIHHQDMGAGELREVIVRGSTKLLTILFDGKSFVTRNVTLNHRVRVLDAETQ